MSFVEQRIKNILTNNQIVFEETEHEAVYTSQKADISFSTDAVILTI